MTDEAQETRICALARQAESEPEKLTYEERVRIAEDVLIIAFYTAAPPDRVVRVSLFTFLTD